MLDTFFNPASIALIGASDDRAKIGGKIFQTLVRERFAGLLYPVNATKPTVGGLPAYARIGAVPATVDLVLIAIPAAHVPAALEECAAAGVANAVIFSSGFSEEGGAGALLQQQIEAICQRTGMRVNGPNSEGFFSVQAGVAATFSPAIDLPRPPAGVRGSGIVSQSGGLGFALYNRGRQRNMAFSKIVSVGNQASLEIADYVEHLLDDADTSSVLLYVESFKRPRRFVRTAQRAAEAGKPLIMAKVGRSRAGQRAAASHTGAMAGSVRVADAVLDHHGVLRAQDQDEMLDLAAAFSLGKPMRGNRVAIVSTSGGTAVWLTDTCEAMGLEVPPIDPGRQARLAEFIPSYGSTDNPVDITAQGVNGYAQSMRILADADYIDAIIIASSFAHDTRLKKEGEAIAELVKCLDKPVFIYSYTLPSESSLRILESLGLFCYTSITGCVRGMQGLLAYSRFQADRSQRRVPAAPPALPAAATRLLAGAEPAMCEYESKALLATLGIEIAPEHLARTPEEAVAHARSIAGPVALKIQSPQIPHKTEAGGVILGCRGEQDVRAATERLLVSARAFAPQADLHGVLVQAMGEPGLEMVAGIVDDPDFGPMVLVGFGGIFVEVLDDTVLAPVPFDTEQARAMLRKLRGYPLLAGVRGRKPRDIDALCNLLVQLSQLAVATDGALVELDINPVFVHEQGSGISIIDALGIRKANRE
jgi:acetate---CoA ligase (ADP-forming)